MSESFPTSVQAVQCSLLEEVVVHLLSPSATTTSTDTTGSRSGVMATLLRRPSDDDEEEEEELYWELRTGLLRLLVEVRTEARSRASPSDRLTHHRLRPLPA